MRRLLAVITVAVCLVASGALAADEKPSVKFDKNYVIATGFGKGDSIVFFGVGLISGGFDNAVNRWSDAVADADTNGTVSFDAGREIPWRSVWIVADTKNGDYVIESPQGFHASRADLLRSINKDSVGADSILSVLAGEPEVLYVHPGLGAWAMHVTPRDFMSHTGVKMFSFASARPLGDTKDAVGGVAPGGLLFVVDVYSMSVSATRLTPAVFGGAN